MCAEYRHMELLTGENIGSAVAAADYGCSGSVGTGIRTLCAPYTKLHDIIALGRVTDAGGLGRDQTLVVADI